MRRVLRFLDDAAYLFLALIGFAFALLAAIAFWLFAEKW